MEKGRSKEYLVADLIESQNRQIVILRKSLLSRDNIIQMLQDTVAKNDMTIELLRTENRILTSKTNKL